MTLIAAASSPARITLRPVTRLFGPSLKLVILVLIGCVVGSLLSDRDHRYLVAPILAILGIAVVHMTLLWQIDGVLPIFEVGTVWLVGTVVYSIVPFIGFIVAGLQWTPSVDARLLQYDFSAQELGMFAWRHAVYIAAFVLTYLSLRGSTSAGNKPLATNPPRIVGALITLLALQYSFKWAMYFIYGLDPGISYSELDAQLVAWSAIPYFLLQITLVALASMLVVKQALLITLISRRSSVRAQAVLIVWLSAEVISVAVRGGQRGSAVLILASAALVYHRFVRPLRLMAVLTGGVVLLTGFLLLGIARGAAIRDNNAALVDVATAEDLITSQNEFQALFATTYDISQRKRLGRLGDIPWQVYAVDLYLEIPSQLLPFEKIDPSQWYLDLIGVRYSGVGFMFGVMSQAVLGLDWIELILRGAALGAIFAVLHRWYVRNARRFWVTILYLFITIWSYYTFRATSLWFVHFVLYQFVPVMLLTKFIAVLGPHPWRPAGRLRQAT